VQQDFVMAMTWYRSAAEQSEPMAMYNIGALFEAGKGVDRNPTEAMSWFRRSAELGDASAMRAIGRLYRNGDSVNMDAVEAYAWHSAAAASFSAQEEAEAGLNKRELADLQKALSSEQISRARQRAEEIKASVRKPAPATAQPLQPGESKT
jgi:TPR repeat protein